MFLLLVLKLNLFLVCYRCAEDVGGDEVKVIDSLEEALKDADVVVTVTMATEPVVCGKWVKSGAVVCSKLYQKNKNKFAT
jgi:ornithine cyclodeaminase/alanine dehydrogenase-like protein (mu-crystallin family)